MGAGAGHETETEIITHYDFEKSMGDGRMSTSSLPSLLGGQKLR